ncbi:unnamed protein product [Owenia fusiformis]|uniref:Uncharacterized protein n=1 Tax=Owenia fusiformis TaxID=6347 RepID=A0A8J1TGV7_OWEFU|nr:unnamed protein product [Owenia fusiformis]
MTSSAKTRMKNGPGTHFIVKEPTDIDVSTIGTGCNATMVTTTGSTSDVFRRLTNKQSHHDMNESGESIQDVLSGINVPQMMEKILIEKKLSLMKSPDVVKFLRDYQKQCEQRTSNCEIRTSGTNNTHITK